MLATAKHFPGHGDTGTDSHLALPVIASTWARLDSVELVPFRAAIAAGVDVVMSAHIALPGHRLAASSGRAPWRPTSSPASCATRSASTGMIVTDALNMAGVADAYGAEAGVRAFLAGADLLLQPADPRAAIDAMERAVARGEITPERLDRSVRRVLEVKRAPGAVRPAHGAARQHPGGRGQRRVPGRRGGDRRALDRDGEGLGRRRSTACARARPAAHAGDLRGGGEPDGRASALAAELRAQGFAVTLARLWPASGAGQLRFRRRGPRGGRRWRVFATADRPIAGRGTIGLPAALTALIARTARARPTVLVSLGNPYLIGGLPEVGSYLIGWRSNAVTEQAVARALAGAAPITGRLPIALPPPYPRGWGLQRTCRSRCSSNRAR